MIWAREVRALCWGQWVGPSSLQSAVLTSKTALLMCAV